MSMTSKLTVYSALLIGIVPLAVHGQAAKPDNPHDNERLSSVFTLITSNPSIGEPVSDLASDPSGPGIAAELQDLRDAAGATPNPQAA